MQRACRCCCAVWRGLTAAHVRHRPLVAVLEGRRQLRQPRDVAARQAQRLGKVLALCVRGRGVVGGEESRCEGSTAENGATECGGRGRHQDARPPSSRHLLARHLGGGGQRAQAGVDLLQQRDELLLVERGGGVHDARGAEELRNGRKQAGGRGETGEDERVPAAKRAREMDGVPVGLLKRSPPSLLTETLSLLASRNALSASPPNRCMPSLLQAGRRRAGGWRRA